MRCQKHFISIPMSIFSFKTNAHRVQKSSKSSEKCTKVINAPCYKGCYNALRYYLSNQLKVNLLNAFLIGFFFWNFKIRKVSWVKLPHETGCEDTESVQSFIRKTVRLLRIVKINTFYEQRCANFCNKAICVTVLPKMSVQTVHLSSHILSIFIFLKPITPSVCELG